jgi:hypothetical protein
MSRKLRAVLEAVASRCEALGDLESSISMSDCLHALGAVRVDHVTQEVVYPPGSPFADEDYSSLEDPS